MHAPRAFQDISWVSQGAILEGVITIHIVRPSNGCEPNPAKDRHRSLTAGMEFCRLYKARLLRKTAWINRSEDAQRGTSLRFGRVCSHLQRSLWLPPRLPSNLAAPSLVLRTSPRVIVRLRRCGGGWS